MATKATDVQNQFRVPVKQWRKWSVKARQSFNSVYDFMMENQFAMLHPKMDAPKPEHYKTICWNAAWIAANAVDEDLPTAIDTAGDVVKVKSAIAGR